MDSLFSAMKVPAVGQVGGFVLLLIVTDGLQRIGQAGWCQGLEDRTYGELVNAAGQATESV